MFIFFEFSEGRKSPREQNKISISRKKNYREKLILIALILLNSNFQQNQKSIKFIAELWQIVKNYHLSNSMTCRMSYNKIDSTELLQLRSVKTLKVLHCLDKIKGLREQEEYLRGTFVFHCNINYRHCNI